MYTNIKTKAEICPDLHDYSTKYDMEIYLQLV